MPWCFFQRLLRDISVQGGRKLGYRTFSKSLRLSSSTTLSNPLQELFGTSQAGACIDLVTEKESKISDYNVAGDITSTLRQDLSKAHRNPQKFEEILSGRFTKEIHCFSIAGICLILEWARKLKLSHCRWEVFSHWHSVSKNWTLNGNMPIEITMAAGAHSYEAWTDFTKLYCAHFKRHPPFDYFVLACFEKCNSLKRAHAEVRSYSVGSIDGAKAAKNLQAADIEVRSFILNGLDSFDNSGVKFEIQNERVAEIIIRSSLYFRSMFLSIRYLWVHLLSNSIENLTGETYEFLLSTCGMYNRQETLVSVDTMLEQVNLYWRHYLQHSEKPYSSDVLFSVLMAYSSCNHKETARLAAGMLELKLSSLYKKEILKCALYAAANQRDVEAFCTLEEYCMANAEYLGEMKTILMRRRAHLLSHHPDDEMLKFYREIPAAMGDRYTTDIVFRWLEQRTNIPGYLLQSVYIAEELWQKLELDKKSPSSIQIECMMAIYAKACDRKGIGLYRNAPVEIITQKCIIEVLRILVTYGYRSGSKGDGEAIWNNLPLGMYKVLERDAASREVVVRFHTSENDSYDLTKLWFNQKTFDPSQCSIEAPNGPEVDHSKMRWDPINPIGEVVHGLRCKPSEYIHGGVWDWGQHRRL